MRVWVVSELYYPEQTSTGYFLTHIAQELAREFEVAALVARPTYAARNLRVPWRERVGGVDVIRCWSTRFDKDHLPLRALNAATMTASFFVNALRRFRRGDVALFVTNPPTIPFALLAACRMRGVIPLLLIHDVYPHLLVASGMVRAGGAAERLMLRLNLALYTSVRRVVTIGRDMTRVVNAVAHGAAAVTMIPNWADVDEIRPMPPRGNPILKEHGIDGKFVVQYAGNMGRTHGLEVLVQAAHILRERSDIHFLLAGAGAKRDWLERAVDGAPNVTILPRQERTNLNDLLNACELSVIALASGMSGISVPSRMYNVMASGRPLLALADSDSEVAMVIAEEELGWTVAPDHVGAFVERIRYAADHPSELEEMGGRARDVATRKYTLARIGMQYRELIASVIAGRA